MPSPSSKGCRADRLQSFRVSCSGLLLVLQCDVGRQRPSCLQRSHGSLRVPSGAICGVCFGSCATPSSKDPTPWPPRAGGRWLQSLRMLPPVGSSHSFGIAISARAGDRMGFYFSSKFWNPAPLVECSGACQDAAQWEAALQMLPLSETRVETTLEARICEHFIVKATSSS